MIEVRVGDRVYSVTDSESYETAARAMATAWRDECDARAAKARHEREAAMLADGWVRVPGGMCRWSRGKWETESSTWRDTIAPPVDLWTRSGAKGKWHMIRAGGTSSACASSYRLSTWSQTSDARPADGLCLVCAKWGAP